MHIPVISRAIVAAKRWLQKIEDRSDLELELRTLFIRDSFADYEGCEDFDSVFASIEKEYIARGLTKEEIRKARDNTSTIIFGG